MHHQGIVMKRSQLGEDVIDEYEPLAFKVKLNFNDEK
jgi:hypothetical protein